MKNNGDQWKLEGKCSICRRKSYCKKQCKANKEFSEKSLRSEVFQAFLGKRFGL